MIELQGLHTNLAVIAVELVFGAKGRATHCFVNGLHTKNVLLSSPSGFLPPFRSANWTRSKSLKQSATKAWKGISSLGTRRKIQMGPRTAEDIRRGRFESGVGKEAAREGGSGEEGVPSLADGFAPPGGFGVREATKEFCE
ncbi:unnamed protein product [Linum trigynum]|uniref:Uncharacterized protein n=1 Tax=Linum trigynum TaxID=586398 RepID=A0AAV2FG41_9ROSI